jgi:hypothetical protein
MTTVLVRVVLVRTLTIDVVLVVHVLSLLLGLSLGLLAVKEVLALGLRELVHFGARKASEKLLGELVGYRLAWKKSTDALGLWSQVTTDPLCAVGLRTS